MIKKKKNPINSSRLARTGLFGRIAVWLIIGFDNIFNIEVNGALANTIVHNSLTQNMNRLKSLDLCFLREDRLLDAIEFRL